jgi:hypothetical protein
VEAAAEYRGQLEVLSTATSKCASDIEESLRRIIRQGIDECIIHPLNEDLIVFSLLSTLRTLYLWYGRKSNLSEQKLRVDLTAALLNGIVKNS